MTEYIFRLVLMLVVIIAYYKYVKAFIIKHAFWVAKQFKMNVYFPANDIKGAIELLLIAGSHVMVCGLLIIYLPIQWPQYSLPLSSYPLFFVYGVLLGVGCMGFSSLISQIAMQFLKTFCKTKMDLKTWLTIARGGWMKHHLQSLQIWPLYLSITILTMQVGSEEIIFRGILLNYFNLFGSKVAVCTALGLFVMTQAFFMQRWQAAIFPMIGAFVMGMVHSFLYLQIPILWPLVVAHISFFLFSVI